MYMLQRRHIHPQTQRGGETQRRTHAEATIHRPQKRAVQVCSCLFCSPSCFPPLSFPLHSVTRSASGPGHHLSATVGVAGSFLSLDDDGSGKLGRRIGKSEWLFELERPRTFDMTDAAKGEKVTIRPPRQRNAQGRKGGRPPSTHPAPARSNARPPARLKLTLNQNPFAYQTF